ncbi:hypothetical protein ACWD4V_32930 [Streptomyces tsukubensis]
MPEPVSRLLDYRLDGYLPADDRVEDDFDFVTMTEEDFTPLAVHHTDRDSYFLFHNGAAVWGGSETPPYVALHITRDLAERTFRFGASAHSLVPLGQRWLIERGCPPESAVMVRPDGTRPSDALTAGLEGLLRTNPGGRYEVLRHVNHSWDNWTLTRDAHPDAAEGPYRVFFERTDHHLDTYTIRERGFPTAEAAMRWIADTTLPFPHTSVPAPVVVSRAEAAVARSPRAPARLAVPPNPVTTPRLAVSAEARTGRGRS